MSGGILGCYLAQNPHVFKTKRFSILLGIFGSAFTLTAILSEVILQEMNIQIYNPQSAPTTIFLRIGFVLLLTAIVSFISLRVNRIPHLLILIGRNTLLIYFIHLVILYGSTWTPGLTLLWGQSFSGWLSFGAAVLMLTLMTFMVLGIHKLKIRNKELET